MKALKTDTINKKISILVTVIIVVSLFGLSAVNYYISKSELSRSNNIILENAIEFTLVEINRNYDYSQDEAGFLSDDAAKANSLASIEMMVSGEIDETSGASVSQADAISSATENSKFAEHSIDLGESGYIFVIDTEGQVLYHPFLEGNLYDLQSRDGKNITQELISLAKSGVGILNYSLTQDKSDVNDSKTVHSQYFPHWDWVIGAVTYDAELARGANQILLYNIIGFIGLLIISLSVTIILSRKITKPIKQVANSLSQVSEGDLTIDKINVNTNDETKLLANSVNLLVDNLGNIVKMTIKASDDLTSYARELSSSSETVSIASNEVAIATTQVAEQSSKQHRDTVDSVDKLNLLGDNIGKSAEASDKMGETLEQNIKTKDLGLSSINDLKDANAQNNENTAILEEQISKINEHSNDINQITTIITNIAKQTNLLALNASIEASRAGEEGQGFSVVADQIRELANESADAAEDINNKIGQMGAQTEEAVTFISKNRLGVEKINQAVDQTEISFNNIAEEMQALAEDINNIIDHTSQINIMKDEILVMLNNVLDATQDNSASTEEIAATAQEQSGIIAEINENISKLNDMATGLNNLVNEFKVN